jgi:hypothetical protein
MSGSDDVQSLVNRLSIVMTIDADIVKACRGMDFSPAMTETLLRLHNQQKELEKFLREQQQMLLGIARTIDMAANGLSSHQKAIIEMQKRLGYGDEETVTTGEVGQGD